MVHAARTSRLFGLASRTFTVLQRCSAAESKSRSRERSAEQAPDFPSHLPGVELPRSAPSFLAPLRPIT